MVVLLGPGQGSDSRMFANVLAAVRVPRASSGRPRTTPDTVMADKAYSSRGVRSHLRRRHIHATIPEPDDQIANRAPAQRSLAHQPLDRAPGHLDALAAKISPHLAGPVHAVVGGVDAMNVGQQFLVPDRPR